MKFVAGLLKKVCLDGGVRVRGWSESLLLGEGVGRHIRAPVTVCVLVLFLDETFDGHRKVCLLPDKGLVSVAHKFEVATIDG